TVAQDPHENGNDRARAARNGRQDEQHGREQDFGDNGGSVRTTAGRLGRFGYGQNGRCRQEASRRISSSAAAAGRTTTRSRRAGHLRNSGSTSATSLSRLCRDVIVGSADLLIFPSEQDRQAQSQGCPELGQQDEQDGRRISATGESVRTKGQLGRQDPGRGMRRDEEAPRPLTQTVHRGGKTKTLPDGFRLPHGQVQQSKDGTNNEDDRLKLDAPGSRSATSIRRLGRCNVTKP
ncbi:hypothetical protein CF327_g6214, partial [Tilletia walkeri]